MRSFSTQQVHRWLSDPPWGGAWRMTLGLLLVGTIAACSSTPTPARTPEKRASVYDDEGGGPSFLTRALGREQAKAPPEPGPLEEYRRTRQKALTVPTDTVNALKLMAQDWVLAAREAPPQVRRAGTGGYVREFNTFSDKYTLEIERADDKDDATLIGYVFLESTHMVTPAHPSEDMAASDKDYRQEPRKLRMTFRLLERWEFSELADGYVFNRVWELERVQFKSTLPAVSPPAPEPETTVSTPQATPRPD